MASSVSYIVIPYPLQTKRQYLLANPLFPGAVSAPDPCQIPTVRTLYYFTTAMLSRCAERCAQLMGFQLGGARACSGRVAELSRGTAVEIGHLFFFFFVGARSVLPFACLLHTACSVCTPLVCQATRTGALSLPDAPTAPSRTHIDPAPTAHVTTVLSFVVML